MDVPDDATLSRLQNSDLDVMDCIPHLGADDVAVGPGGFAELDSSGYTYTVTSKLEDPANWGARHWHPVSRTDDYRLHYYDADQILGFYEGLRAQYPTIVSRISIGTTINGETIWAYRFAYAAGSRSQANNIVVESLIHAREWISGACTMHIAKMVCDLFNSGVSRALANQVVWIVPMVNPDGYRYTWTSDRLWRKNRRHNSGGSYGVDLNRNFSKGWGGANGSSGTQSSETYRGTAAFSEPESQAVRNLVQSLPRVGGFIDYHSYAQLILAPWGYTLTAPPGAATFDNIGNQIKVPMSGFGATYDAGQCSQILYIASGISNDYVYDSRGTPAFGIELRDTGQNGFLLPEDQIYATQDEVWAGFSKYMQIVGP